jgi:hypothetical protein
MSGITNPVPRLDPHPERHGQIRLRHRGIFVARERGLQERAE